MRKTHIIVVVIIAVVDVVVRKSMTETWWKMHDSDNGIVVIGNEQCVCIDSFW